MSTRSFPGIHVLVVPPSPWSSLLKQAVVQIAEAAGVPVFDTFYADGQPLEEGSLFICASALGLDRSQAARMAIILGDSNLAPTLIQADQESGELDAIRVASNCYAFATTLAESGAGLAIRESEFCDDPGAALAALLAELELTPVAAEQRAYIKQLERKLEGHFGAAREPEGNRLAADALAIYRSDLDGEPARAWWPRELFKWSDDPGQPPPESIDVTGVARSVLIGPYLGLPAGHWRVTAHLDLDEEASRRIFLFSFGSGGEFSHHQTMGLHPGRNEISLEHRFAMPGAAEFAVGFPFGAFDGTLQFRGLTVERVRDSG